MKTAKEMANLYSDSRLNGWTGTCESVLEKFEGKKAAVVFSVSISACANKAFLAGFRAAVEMLRDEGPMLAMAVFWASWLEKRIE